MNMTTNRTAATQKLQQIAQDRHRANEVRRGADLAAWAEARYAKYLAAGATDAEAIAGTKQDMLALAGR
jgi:hypothetical protein